MSRSFDTARTQAVHIHHIQKNETEEQPLEQDQSDWDEVLEDERLAREFRREQNSKLLQKMHEKSNSLCQIHRVSEGKLESTKMRL